jgi:hypothetical protein
MLKVVLGIILVLLVGCTSVAVAQEAPQSEWTEHEAQTVVYYKIWERQSRCNRNDCYTRDPVLINFRKFGLAPDLLPGFAGLFLDGATFHATYHDNCRCWQVSGVFREGEEDQQTLIWWVWENTGIVESDMTN